MNALSWWIAEGVAGLFGYEDPGAGLAKKASNDLQHQLYKVKKKANSAKHDLKKAKSKMKRKEEEWLPE